MHPHLAEACRAAGVREASFDPLEPEPYPIGLPAPKPFRLALAGLRDWFLALLDRLGYDKADIESVVLRFRFRAGDDYNSAVTATISTSRGKEYAGYANYIGR